MNAHEHFQHELSGIMSRLEKTFESGNLAAVNINLVFKDHTSEELIALIPSHCFVLMLLGAISCSHHKLTEYVLENAQGTERI